MRPPLAIVAAIGRNGALGRDGRLPWTMPGDLARFRTLTMGKPMIMGRRTWDSIGRPLPGRESIVVTRDPALPLPDGVYRVGSAAAALTLAKERALVMGAHEMALIGGATLFAEMMDETDRLYMTIIDLAPEADTFFPAIDPTVWREARRVVPARHPHDEAACVFVDYDRYRR